MLGTMRANTSQPRGRADLVLVGTLLVIAALGVLVSVQPFTGDQALFASGARQLAHGDVLYRDFWDVKQPGIYGFYLLGGELVGYGEVRVHLFELGVLLAFAALLGISLRDRFRHRWIASVVPLLVAGTFYATAEPVQLGQIESLVGVPLYVTLWSGARASQTRRRAPWLLGAGLAGGVVLAFKLVLAPIVLALWLVAIVPTRVAAGAAAPPGRRKPPGVAHDAGWILLGAAIPVGLVVAYLAVHGQLATARWTYLDVPRVATGLAGRPADRLVGGLARTTARWAFPLGLGAIGVVAGIRRGWDRFAWGLAWWIALGVPVFLAQHWWIYQYAMFLVPVGVFAGDGLEAVVESWSRTDRTRRVGLVAGGLLLLAPLGLRIESNTRVVVRHGFALTAGDRRALRAEVEPHYRAADAWARHLRRVGPTPHGVYVLGNPLDLYRSGRRQSVAVNGWSPEQYPAEVWARLTRELVRAGPDEVVVDRFSARIMRERSPRTLRVIHARYRRVGGHGADTWYRRRDAGPATSSIDGS